MTNIAVKLAETVRSFGVGAVYGDPVEIEGQTLVPVAISWFGFGGSGSDDAASGLAGGGGGGAAIPVGAYVTQENGRVAFEPNLISLLAVSIPTIWVTGKAFARIIRALKK
ncbi:hypothetical protein ASF06_10425 [Agreia sp. Leaf244]|jgi:uncharacterized spore protein YtfJ|uniref:hypothetical protein n=1 Tax=unclassified Agreia TaxID=2641148 RepID=UPI0006FC6911|nr:MULTISPECIES: hypothetical protein [unclassified Agreia]KQO08570.1 hypothetical protein ASF06_10425 [Agreia sp. Leaf244]KQP54649.1 hypothetical protein ASF51_15230 [Agreia sp. Leaf283]